MASLLETRALADGLDSRKLRLGDGPEKTLNNQTTTYTLSEMGILPANGIAASTSTLFPGALLNNTIFNGSQNISTSRWGTARTITLGNHSQEAGVTNASWSVSEIGITGGLERLDLVDVTWDSDAGIGSRTYSVRLPIDWPLGEYRVCAIISNGSYGRYYLSFVPWSDMPEQGASSNNLRYSVGAGSSGIFSRGVERNITVQAPNSGDRIIKVWLERIPVNS